MTNRNKAETVDLLHKNIPVYGEFDVLVVGGGPAGFAAAIGAARAGAKTVLIEAGPAVLANVTQGPLEAIMTFHDSTSQVIKGVAQEFIDRCTLLGGSTGHITDTTGYSSTITPFSPEIAKLAAYEMIEEAGVSLYLQTSAEDCLREEGAISLVMAKSRTERFALIAKNYVDCTGDGDLAYLAGCSFEKGDENGKLQPMTSLMRLGGVDYKGLINYVCENKKDFKFFDERIFEEWLIEGRTNEQRPLHLWGFGSVLKKGHDEGCLSLKRNEMHIITGFNDNEAIINFTRYDGDGTSVIDRTQAQVATVKQAYELYVWLRKTVAPFKDSWLVSIGTVGIREGRRIKGKYHLTKDDIIAGRTFADSVAKGAFPIDIHKPGSDSMESIVIRQSYSIPMGCLISNDIRNLYMGGRCISCSHEAQASVRITATAMATGQASGIMAALASKYNSPNYNLEYTTVKEELEKQGILPA